LLDQSFGFLPPKISASSPSPVTHGMSFERRLSSIADILKRLDIGDDLLPEGEALDKSHTLDRLDRVFGSRLDAPDLANVQEA
jgi:hypothetical protein